MSYSAEFIHFIKSTLINSCFKEYCKYVYSIADIESQNFKYNLLDYKNEKYIWDNVFNIVSDLLTYYLHLSVDYHNVLNLDEKASYCQNRLASNYEQVTFQTYIDNQVNFQNVGYREYQNFIKSMQNPSFKKKMIDKYKADSEVKTLKNHIIYVVHLHLSQQIDSITIFTDEEKGDMNTIINTVPYFEHLSKNYWSIDDIESGLIHEPKADQSIKMMNFNSLEARVLKQITNSM